MSTTSRPIMYPLERINYYVENSSDYRRARAYHRCSMFLSWPCDRPEARGCCRSAEACLKARGADALASGAADC